MNKILVQVYIPVMEKEVEIYIPINKKIGTVKQFIIQTISEMEDIDISKICNFKLYDKVTGEHFNNSIYINESSIRNGTKLLLL